MLETLGSMHYPNTVRPTIWSCAYVNRIWVPAITFIWTTTIRPPILFYNLSSQQTGATVTCKQNRCGLPTAFKTAQVKKKGDQPTYDNQMKLLKIYDRKAVALLSTISTGEMVPTGKCHWQTKLPMEKPEMIVLFKNSWEELIVMISSFSIQALIVDR